MSAGRTHFVGVGGSGMRALAYLLALAGRPVSGSDRTYDREPDRPVFASLAAAGVRFYPQDGSGVGPDLARLVVSTAVEETVPDLARARALGVPVLHRSEILAEIGHAAPALVAVAGTSGKSTVTAMLAAILEAAGADPLVVNGAAAVGRPGPPGLAGTRAGAGPAVIEADESDGSLVRYHPAVSVFVTLDWDHKPLPEVRELFRTLAGQTRDQLVLGVDSPGIAATDWPGPPARRVGRSAGADLRLGPVERAGWTSRFSLDGRPLELGVPGEHNAANAALAAAAALALGLPWPAVARGLAGFRGVHRRLERIGERRGVTVVDDFAHNPEKIAASVAALRPLAKRLLAVYQPHGFGPTRFLKDRLVESFAAALTADDRLFLPEIFYAGGSAVKDISSADIAREVRARGVPSAFFERRDEIVPAVAAEARAGDVILVMGARDDSLTDLCRRVLEALECESSSG